MTLDLTNDEMELVRRLVRARREQLNSPPYSMSDNHRSHAKRSLIESLYVKVGHPTFHEIY